MPLPSPHPQAILSRHKAPGPLGVSGVPGCLADAADSSWFLPLSVLSDVTQGGEWKNWSPSKEPEGTSGFTSCDHTFTDSSEGQCSSAVPCWAGKGLRGREVKIMALGSPTPREDAEGARAEEESGGHDGPQTETQTDWKMP